MTTRLLSLSVAVFVLSTLSTLTWAQNPTVVTTEDELVAAVLTDGANIQFGNDITVAKHVTIATNVTIDLNGHEMRGNDAELPLSGDFKCLFITATEGTLTLRNGTLAHSDNRGAQAHNSSIGRAHSAGAIVNKGEATLENITITNCQGIEGGAIRNTGVLHLHDGCSITGNTASSRGGGIWQDGTMTVQGTIVLKDNQREDELQDNVYLLKNRLITVDGELTGKNIYVNMQTAGTFTSGYNAYNNGVHPSQRFTPDYIPTWQIGRDGDNEARLERYEGRIGFIERSWDDVNKKVVSHYRSWSEDEYTVLDHGRDDNYISYEVGGDKIVVKGNPTFDGAVQFTSEHVQIVLADNSCLTAEGVNCNNRMWNTSITIYAEEGGGTLGKIHSDAYWDDHYSGIGEYYDSYCPVTIHGGDIYARGGNAAPGIGSYVDKGDDDKDGGDITIYGGKIEAIGGSGASGIGSGSGVPHYGTISIYGGTIIARVISSTESLYASNSAPGIGGGNNCKGGTTHIYGGDITAEGHWEAAGIGCSQTSDVNTGAGHIIIDGGKVVARGAWYAAGIGGGDGVNGCLVEINGGHVEAYGGRDAAGIGGGEGANGGTITITGGYVYAEGGEDYGAGIGGGEDGNGGNVTISGGTVVTKSGCNSTGCRAIGPGKGSDNYGSLALGDELKVTSERTFTTDERKNACWYRTDVRVEACEHSSIHYELDAEHPELYHIAHCDHCKHVEAKEEHTFDENNICTKCGYHPTYTFITIFVPYDDQTGTYDGHTYLSTEHHVRRVNETFTLPIYTGKVPGLQFVGWEAFPCSVSNPNPPLGTYTEYGETLYQPGDIYTMSEDWIDFAARFDSAHISLADDGDNGQTLALFNNRMVASVTLSGRTFTKDGNWGSICLPFNLNAEELAASPLAGCQLKALDTEHSRLDSLSGKLYVNFIDATTIEAGKPYMIRWTSGEPVSDPVFRNVTISADTDDACAERLTFKGTFSHKTYDDAHSDIRFIAPSGALIQPDGANTVTIGACRAYFRLNND